MSPVNRDYLSPMEEELMEMLWYYAVPMTSKDMAEAEYQHSWKDSYLKLIIRSLKDLGAIRVCGGKEDKKQFLRVYEPALTRAEYAAKLAASRIDDNEQISKTMVAFAKEKCADEEELIKRLEEIIEELRKE